MCKLRFGYIEGSEDGAEHGEIIVAFRAKFFDLFHLFSVAPEV